MFAKLKKIFSHAAKPECEKLTDSIVKRLIGHTNVVYYNCETNAWNTDTYNGYTIDGQNTDTKLVKQFKAGMARIPEFNKLYEFCALVAMTIDKLSFPAPGKQVRNPQYKSDGTSVVGNIIVKNKQTGKYELYCKLWNYVHDYSLADIAVDNVANGFAVNGAKNFKFRIALIVAHIQQNKR